MKPVAGEHGRNIFGQVPFTRLLGARRESSEGGRARLVLDPRPELGNVIGVPDARWGEAVHAVVVPTAEGSTTADELRTWCRERLAGYKCPRHITFVRELPLSAAGKVLKTQLRAEHAKAR